jgi:hypothetical protein
MLNYLLPIVSCLIIGWWFYSKGQYYFGTSVTMNGSELIGLNTGTCNGYCFVGHKKWRGNHLSISDGVVYVDGKLVDCIKKVPNKSRKDCQSK